MSETRKPMLMVTLTLTNQQKTFILIPNPLYKDTMNYTKGIYNPENKTLVLLSNCKRDVYNMIPKLDSNGDLLHTKKPRVNGGIYAEQRALVTTPDEFEITEKQEIINIIEMIADNSASFDYKKYLEDSKIIVPNTPKLEIIK